MMEDSSLTTRKCVNVSEKIVSGGTVLFFFEPTVNMGNLNLSVNRIRQYMLKHADLKFLIHMIIYCFLLIFVT